jgi:hypothetical protein
MIETLTLEQLSGMHARLRQELADAHAASADGLGRMDRIAEDLAAVERALARHRSRDEQTDDPMFGFGP